MNQLGKPLGNAVGKLGGAQQVNSSELSFGNGVAREIVAGDVGNAQVRTDLDLEGKLRRVPLPNGGMEQHAKGLARSVRGCWVGGDEGREQRT